MIRFGTTGSEGEEGIKNDVQIPIRSADEERYRLLRAGNGGMGSYSLGKKFNYAR